MATAWDMLVGRSLEWADMRLSNQSDFNELSTHVVSDEMDHIRYVTAAGRLVGEARCTYRKLDERMPILIYIEPIPKLHWRERLSPRFLPGHGPRLLARCVLG